MSVAQAYKLALHRQDDNLCVHTTKPMLSPHKVTACLCLLQYMEDGLNKGAGGAFTQFNSDTGRGP
jgi:hypothetical protein